jgi:predicted transcriptional regulator
VVQRRRARPKFIPQSFVEYADQSIRHCDWALAFYREQRKKGKGHYAAIRSLAFKWIRIIYRCWQERVAYDEEKYLAALQRRHSS